MFKIEYKMYESCLVSNVYDDYYPDIADYFDTVGTVYGDILITVNKSRYGFISESCGGDYGETVLDFWLNELLKACIALYSGTVYRIREIECADIFLYLNKMENGGLSVSCLSGGKAEWAETINCNEFIDEVICTSGKFIDDLLGYSERTAYSPVFEHIKDKLNELKKIKY